MGAAVGAVVGGVSLISGISSQKKQEAAQRAQIQAQSQAAADNAALRQLEIDKARDYANYQNAMNSLARQQQYQTQRATLESQKSVEAIQEAQTRFNNEASLLSNKAALVRNEGQIQQQQTQAEVDYEKQLQQLSEYLSQNSQQARESYLKQGQLLDQGEIRRIAQEAYNTAAGIAVGSQTSQAQQTYDFMKDATTYAQALQETNAGREVAKKMAEAITAQSQAERDLKLLEVSKLLGDVDRQYSQIQAQYDMTNTSIDNTLQQNANSRDIASQTVEMANAQAIENEKTNKLMAESGYDIQTGANTATLMNSLAALDAQRQAIPGGFLSYLNAGINAYNTARPYLDNSLSQAKRSMEVNAGLLGGLPNTTAQQKVNNRLQTPAIPDQPWFIPTPSQIDLGNRLRNGRPTTFSSSDNNGLLTNNTNFIEWKAPGVQ